MISEYTIRVTRNGGECVAGISELCIAEKGVTPQEAVLAVLRAEKNALETLERDGIPLPPFADHLDPFPRVTLRIVKCFPFIAKVVVGYVLAAGVTAALLAVIFPSVRTKAENYILSENAAADAGKVLSRLGISLCLEKP